MYFWFGLRFARIFKVYARDVRIWDMTCEILNSLCRDNAHCCTLCFLKARRVLLHTGVRTVESSVQQAAREETRNWDIT